MTVNGLVWWWLVRAAVLSGLVLVAGSLAAIVMREPADRLRIIQWTFLGCLIAPWLPGSTGWNAISLSLVPARTPIVSATEATAANRDLRAPATGASLETSQIGASGNAGAIATGTAKALNAEKDTVDRPRVDEVKVVATEQPISTPAPSTTTFETTSSQRLRAWLVVAYVATCFTMVLWWMVGIWRRSALERAAIAAPDNLRGLCSQMAGPAGQSVRLLVSDEIDGPITWGLFRPVIVLPARFAKSADHSNVRWCLAHELSHVENRDVATLLLASLAQLLCFYNPIYWWLGRQMILCQDYIADARAAQETGSPEDYAEFLVQLAGRRLQPTFAASLGIIDRKSRLFRRVKMLFDSQRPLRSRCRPAASLLIAITSIFFLTGISTIKLDAANGEPPAKRVANAASAPVKPTESRLVGVVQGMLIRASDKTPVADARVTLWAGGAKYTETDREGRFRFEKIPPNPRGYEIWAYHENLMVPKTPVRQTSTADANKISFEPLRLEMIEGKQAKFLVADKATGKPIRGAIIRFNYPDRRKADTGGDGSALVQGLMPEEHWVTIEADGYARAAPQIDLSHSGGISEYKVPLLPGGIVRGVVVDANGKPVPGADVLYREGGGIGYYGDAYKTDKSGRFRHRFLPLNTEVEVSARKEGYIEQKQDVALTPAKSELEVRLTIARRPKGGSVVGTVTDSNNRPIAAATVANFGHSSNPHAVTKTDGEGKFRLDDLVEDYEIAVSAKRFSPQIVTVQPGTAERPGSVNVSLKPGHTIRGRVVNERGEPMKQAYVSVRGSEYWGQLGESVDTDDKGEFAFDSLPADVRFDVSMPTYPRLGNIPLKLDTDETATVTLELPAAIHGIVVDAESGQPLRQFRVRVGFCRSRQPGDAESDGIDSQWANPGLTFNSGDGRFAIGPLINRVPLELTVDAEGYDRQVVARAVAAKDGKAEEVRVLLKRTESSERFTLNGQLLDYAGKPVSGAQLRLIVSSDQPTGANDNKYNWALISSGQLAQQPYVEQYVSYVTNAEGRFEFSNISPLKYLQLAYWGDGVPKGRSLAFDETRPGKTDTVTIKLPQPATVHGTIDRTTLADAGSVQLNTDRESFLNFKVELSADQTAFEFHDVPPGRYSLSVVGKPDRYTENGHTFYRYSPLAHENIVLQRGENKEVNFKEPDKKR